MAKANQSFYTATPTTNSAVTVYGRVVSIANGIVTADIRRSGSSKVDRHMINQSNLISIVEKGGKGNFAGMDAISYYGKPRLKMSKLVFESVKDGFSHFKNEDGNKVTLNMAYMTAEGEIETEIKKAAPAAAKKTVKKTVKPKVV